MLTSQVYLTFVEGLSERLIGICEIQVTWEDGFGRQRYEACKGHGDEGRI